MLPRVAFSSSVKSRSLAQRLQSLLTNLCDTEVAKILEMIETTETGRLELMKE